MPNPHMYPPATLSADDFNKLMDDPMRIHVKPINVSELEETTFTRDQSITICSVIQQIVSENIRALESRLHAIENKEDAA